MTRSGQIFLRSQSDKSANTSLEVVLPAQKARGTTPSYPNTAGPQINIDFSLIYTRCVSTLDVF